MSVEDYDALACRVLGLYHPALGRNSDVTVGSFCIPAHPEVFDALAEQRFQITHETLFGSNEFQEELSEEELYDVLYQQAPPTLSVFLDHTSKMPEFARDYSRYKAEYDQYIAAFNAIEDMMEREHPGITRKGESYAYQTLSGKCAGEYKHHTGLNVHTLAAKAEKLASQLKQKYNGFITMYYRDYWDKNRFDNSPSGYLKHMVENYPNFGQMLLRNVPLFVPSEARKRHTYIVGATGSGKSELIKLLANGDIQSGEASVVMVDPHGDLVQQLSKLSSLFSNPADAERLIYIDPFLHGDHTPVINPLDCDGTTTQEREVIAGQLVNAFEELLKGSAGSSLTLNMRTLLKPCLLVLLDKLDSTLADLQAFMHDDRNDYWINLGLQSPRQSVRAFFENEFANVSFHQSKESIRNKLQLLFN